eukprot:TRINITY_DN4488_c0_g1_i1.p1 TRINITY_DN4488_c0_g1~~TRINITY_DN4488_c0_g1_i1.p1  ORF type:complete len:568 (+),score=96.39 TRINITY_DN4488_c0_g1_i1:106-1809(+)
MASGTALKDEADEREMMLNPAADGDETGLLAASGSGENSDKSAAAAVEASWRVGRLALGASALLAVAGGTLVFGRTNAAVLTGAIHKVNSLVLRPPDREIEPPVVKSATTGIEGDEMLGMLGPGDTEVRMSEVLPDGGLCLDKDAQCAQLALAGDCATKAAEMQLRCRKSCNLCTQPAVQKPAVWQDVPGYVVNHEGGDAGMMVTTDIKACQNRCDGNPSCNSFTYCLDGKCYFKTKKITGHEPFHANKWCGSHFKSSEYLVTDPALLQPSAATTHTFYMYRAQTGPHFYAPGNVNTGSIAGVMWYLHNEVVGTCHGKGFLSQGELGDRKFAVDRIRRMKVTVKATTPLMKKGLNFGVLQAFDSGETTGPHKSTKQCGPGSGSGSTPEWNEYGYHVGCGMIGDWPHQNWASGKAYPNTVWYSLPGPCPQMTYKTETEQCKVSYPGGLCTTPTGQGNCTYSYEEAGYIMVDHLVGIEPTWTDRKAFCSKCSTEGGPTWKGGCGLDFWGHDIWNKADNEKRVQLALDEFHRKYPDLPKETDIPPPRCDFDKRKYGFRADWETWDHNGYN